MLLVSKRPRPQSPTCCANWSSVGRPSCPALILRSVSAFPPQPNRPVERGDLVEIEVSTFGDGPDAIGTVDGSDYVVFVPGVLPGERVRVCILSATRKFARGVVDRILTPVDERVDPVCRHFLDCGGCQRQHQEYGAQLREKTARLRSTLAHGLGDAVELPMLEPIPARPPLGQRHKVALHLQGEAGRMRGGFHRLRSIETVWIRECPTADPLAWDLANEAVDALNELPHEVLGGGAWHPDWAPEGTLRSVLVRTTTTGLAHLVIVSRQPFVPGIRRLVDRLHHAGATTISINHNPGDVSRLLGERTVVVSGHDRIEETIGDHRYSLSSTAFFQTSPQAAEALVDAVVQGLEPGPNDLIADLYCGVGLFSMPLAKRCRALLGIEIAERAVEDAEIAAVLNGVGDRVTFRAGPVERWLDRCGQDVPEPDLVVVDPPRAGLSEQVVEQLARLAPRRIAYVSCDLASLKRDAADLVAAGYGVRSLQVVDMFPHTSHIESVAIFEYRGAPRGDSGSAPRESRGG